MSGADDASLLAVQRLRTGVVPAGSVVEIAEIIKEGYDQYGLCYTSNGESLGRVQLSDLKSQPNQETNDDIGLHARQKGERSKTGAIIAERIAKGHRSGPELDRFWTLLAVCHQAEAEHPPADDATQAYLEQHRIDGKRLMEEAYGVILANGEIGVEKALSKQLRL